MVFLYRRTRDVNTDGSKNFTHPQCVLRASFKNDFMIGLVNLSGMIRASSMNLSKLTPMVDMISLINVF